MFCNKKSVQSWKLQTVTLTGKKNRLHRNVKKKQKQKKQSIAQLSTRHECRKWKRLAMLWQGPWTARPTNEPTKNSNVVCKPSICKLSLINKDRAELFNGTKLFVRYTHTHTHTLWMKELRYISILNASYEVFVKAVSFQMSCNFNLRKKRVFFFLSFCCFFGRSRGIWKFPG